MADGDPIKVLCVDDNAIIAIATSATIDATDDMSCVGCLNRADTLLDTVAELQPDAVLLDLHMPGKDPLTVLRDLTQDHPDVAVIVLSGFSDAETEKEALAAGARRYLTKDGSSQSILDAIRVVAARNI